MEATGLLAVLRVSGGRWRRRGAEKEKEPSTEASVLGLEGKTETLRTSREFEESRERERKREREGEFVHFAEPVFGCNHQTATLTMGRSEGQRRRPSSDGLSEKEEKEKRNFK